MNRITQILTKYRIGLAKAEAEKRMTDEQIDILTDKAGEALLEWLDKEVIGEDYIFNDDAFPTAEEQARQENMNRLLAAQRRKARK